jgi:cbb3-type cytochrome oxidase maturation protein
VNIIFFLAIMTLLLSLGFAVVFVWATFTGQWDDLDMTPVKILEEPTNTKEEKA